jgi:hypothetical protein
MKLQSNFVRACALGMGVAVSVVPGTAGAAMSSQDVAV